MNNEEDKSIYLDTWLYLLDITHSFKDESGELQSELESYSKAVAVLKLYYDTVTVSLNKEIAYIKYSDRKKKD